jgi:hypothetical protein
MPTAHRLGRTVPILAGLTLALGVMTLDTSAAAAPPLAAVGSSLSGSIVYVKDHNVWLANGNGTGQYQVTLDGSAASPYSSPTQSDTGVIAASQGQRIVRMTQNGTVLSSVDPAPLPGSAGHPIDGPPQDLAISPDGSKIAYTLYTYSCPIAGPGCMARTATAVTDAGGLTPYQTYGATYLATPSWIGNGRTLQNGGYGSHMVLKDVAGAEQVWFNDKDVYEPNTDLADSEVSPDGRWLAAVRGYGNDEHIIWYAVSGNPSAGAPPPVPAPACVTGEQAGFADPTWAPDSNALAWQEPDGIWLKNDPQVCDNPQPQLLIPGGSEPDWSASPVAPAPRVFKVSGKPKLAGPAKVGKKLKASVGSWTPAPASFRYTWLRNGKPIKRATKATYKVTAKDRGKKISVRVTGSGPGYPSLSVTSPAKKVKGR